MATKIWSSMNNAASSLDANELARFSGHTQDWWDPDGVWSPLHKLNPTRIDYIAQSLRSHFAGISFKSLSVLDIGCGGGLVCEPLRRLGLNVTGLDPSEKAIKVARDHAKQQKLAISYIHDSAESLAATKKRFDAVIALEIVEHVADIDCFLKTAANLLKPGGLFIISTVNRTTKSYLLGIVMAEYVLHWVAPGMHDWHKFVRPSELDAHLRNAGLKLADLSGMVYNPLNDSFRLHKDVLGVNYLASATKVAPKISD